ncbi:MAG: cation:proton antiporter [Bacteroidales bacterium]|nr:cation:proton antiporter [Bacteroidales bacterium]
MSLVIIFMGVLYFVGHLLTHIFNRSKIPDVLILILFGIIIGPLLRFVTPEEIGTMGKLLTSLALIVMLFESGLNMELKTLILSARQALNLSFISFLMSAAIVFSIMYFGFEYSSWASALTGFICGGTSSAVVIPMVRALKVSNEASTIAILESALTDVFCIVFTLGVVDSFDSGEFEIGKIIGNLISSLVMASVIGLVAGSLWLYIIDKVRIYPNSQFATFAFMFIVYGIAEKLDYSGAIAALAFGIIMGNNMVVYSVMRRLNITRASVGVVTDAEKMLYKEIVFLLKIFFFIYLGICIPFNQMHLVLIALSIVIGIYTMRPFVTKLLVKKRTTPYDREILSVMVPKGLAAAVLASVPIQHGLAEGGDVQTITYNIVFISIIVTSVAIPIIEDTPMGKIFRKFFTSKYDVEEEQDDNKTMELHVDDFTR